MSCRWLAGVCFSLALATAFGAGRFEGTFKSDRMTVTLAADGGQYKGTIDFNQKKFPCQAREAGPALQGTFATAGGHAFPFTATLAGNTLTLESGTSTYALQREAANPLDGPVPPDSPGRTVTIDVAQLKADFRRALEAHDRKDYATALQIVRPVAEQGHVGARYLLALLYEHGRGLPADPAEAARWYARAEGYAPALLNLGMLYRDGRGVAKDLTKARELFEQAAWLGSAGAQRALGAVHVNGLGVPRNPVEGVAWMYLAEKGGDQTARENLAMIRMGNFLSPEQWQQVTQRAAALQQEIAQRRAGSGTAPQPAAGGAPDFSSPEATVRTLAAACAASNAETIRQCISAQAVDELARLRDGQVAANALQGFFDMFKGVTIDEIERLGAAGALVHVKLPNSPRKKETLDMIKEPGGWKILDF